MLSFFIVDIVFLEFEYSTVFYRILIEKLHAGDSGFAKGKAMFNAFLFFPMIR